MKLFFKVYSLLWKIVIPFLKNHKRLKEGYSQRTLELGEVYSPCDVVLYAASGGEALLACELMSKLPDYLRICCFSWTKEGVHCIQRYVIKENKHNVQGKYAPFDDPKLTTAVLKILQPKLCLVIETEIWLGFMYSCHCLHIPYMFINARMSEKTLNGLKHLHKILLKIPPTKVFALSEEHKNRFQELFFSNKADSPVFLMKNMKFDTALKLLKKPAHVNKEQNALTVLFGSVRQEEEELLLPCIQNLLAEFPQVQIIVVPKHRERAEFWVEALKEQGNLLSTHGNNIDNLGDFSGKVCIVDTFGLLASLYQTSHLAFVGGSLVPLGGQNFLEALAGGIIPFTGKYLENFSWAINVQPSLMELGLIHQVENSEDLFQALALEIENKSITDFMKDKERVKTEFAQWLFTQCGGSKEILDEIVNLYFSQKKC